MRANNVFTLYYQNQIPLADIKIIFDGYYQIPFDSLGLIGESKTIPDKEAYRVLDLLKKGYPAVYLVGYADIKDISFFLNEDVLIPRIETEEFIYEYLANNYDFSNKKILDLCTGSGFIALSIKKLFPSANILATDISSKALAIAKKNSDYNHLEIELRKSDFFSDIKETFDVIVSNPPYIEDDSKDVYAPFEPELALYSGKDGLDSYRKIFSDLDKHLNKKGVAFFELEATNALKTEELFKQICQEAYEVSFFTDLEGKKRYLIVKKSS